eukprot:TRINITY_DN8464_c0_g1_i1.p2 TRINITY_DN8464_c0_g1~~TRINITY_DN8464_c0_g1_i1.p2  ORF type:complete len:588 (-),score=211.57 TRINITY_DN8464_c0_g1_i1:188-1951(-)
MDLQKALAQAEQWLKWDKNPETRAEVEKIVASNDEKELIKRFGQRISFGTAGLRGTMQAGWSAMNDLTVIQASQGLCVYLEKMVENFKSKGVFIGYDGRHHSRTFAELTAATFASRGATVYLMQRLTATPLVSFGTTAFGCAAGVMVTASHNPAADNGYKVYWTNGAQIVSPHDKGIATEIDANLAPWPIDVPALLKSALVHDPVEELIRKYYAAILSKCCYHRAENAAAKVPVVFTPMHGVGKEWTARAFETFGLPPYIPVPEQIEPDADFPTVSFPNPEEKGALDCAMRTADRNNARLVIANDPDADRLAAAERQPDGKWKVFNGNEIGILLAHWCWSQYKAAHPDVVPGKCSVLNSTVSSKMLRAMAEKEGLYYEETLTGFKWLGNRAQQLEQNGYTFIFAFEEAIGFMVSDVCLDKDGVRGAAVFAEMANYLDRQGQLCSGYLQSLYDKYGYFETNNRYFFCYDPVTLDRIFAEIRNNGQYCTHVGAFKVKHIRDLTVGYDDSQPDKQPLLPVSKSTQMVTFTFDNGCVATLRGSGTEPKLKYYVEFSGQDPATVHRVLNEIVDAVIAQLLQPEKNGLLKPTD